MSAALKIGVVGPCAAGKSTLISGLKLHGYPAKHIAQEHSFVPDMWQRFSNPDVLIFLDVSYPITRQRRKLDWSIKEYEEQQKRLIHARQNANYYLDTDRFTISEVLDLVLAFLKENAHGNR
jgi:hypothetical protein